MLIPPWLLEGSNGATAVALLFVVAFQIGFLIAVWIKIQTPSDYRTSLASFYFQMKPVIALTVMFAGLLLRFGIVWAQQHARNHGLPPLISPGIAIATHAVGTFASVVGVLCWLRVTIPRFCGPLLWLAIVVMSCLVFISPLFL